MNEIEEKHRIQAAIQSFSKTGLSKASLVLFSVLGYNTVPEFAKPPTMLLAIYLFNNP
jgi:hypothetical protein